MKNRGRYIVKLIAAFVAILMIVALFSGCVAEEKVIGIAWRTDTDSEFYTNVIEAVKQVGAKPVLLEQVVADYLSYDENGTTIIFFKPLDYLFYCDIMSLMRW